MTRFIFTPRKDGMGKGLARTIKAMIGSIRDCFGGKYKDSAFFEIAASGTPCLPRKDEKGKDGGVTFTPDAKTGGKKKSRQQSAMNVSPF